MLMHPASRTIIRSQYILSKYLHNVHTFLQLHRAEVFNKPHRESRQASHFWREQLTVVQVRSLQDHVPTMWLLDGRGTFISSLISHFLYHLHCSTRQKNISLFCYISEALCVFMCVCYVYVTCMWQNRNCV